MTDALAVWDAATASEKAELTQEFIKKKNLYLPKMYNGGPEAQEEAQGKGSRLSARGAVFAS
jgi:hypothetical protein